MRLIYLVLVSLLLAGCGGEEFQDLHDFVKNSGVNMRGKIPPPPEVKPYVNFIYNNDTSLPDPFKPRKPALHQGQAGLNQPDLDRPKEALEEFPLEGLKVVGYLQQNKISYAVIRAPDEKLYRVKAGNYLGLNFGKILEISDSEVKIKEVIQDTSGDWSERISTSQLVE